VIADEPASEGQRLPTGQHGLPAELVARNQRERLIAAMAEVCWEESYAEVAVADIAGRARVSTATFYRCFADKRECLLATHEELFGRLLDEVDAACAAVTSGEGRVRTAVRTCLELLAADPPTARLLTVEVLAAGPEGSERYTRAIEELARRLRPDQDPSDVTRAEWAAAAALTAIVGREAMAGRAESLPELEEELLGVVR
jgi:AcrR family transcriptional regulator